MNRAGNREAGKGPAATGATPKGAAAIEADSEGAATEAARMGDSSHRGGRNRAGGKDSIHMIENLL